MPRPFRAAERNEKPAGAAPAGFRWGLTMLFCVLFSSTAYGGPWVHAPGDGYLKCAVSTFFSDDAFNRGIATGFHYRSVTARMYGEVGLPGGLQLVGDLPYVVATHTSSGDLQFNNHSLGDARIRMEFDPLFQRRAEQYGYLLLPVSLNLEVKVPLYQPLSDRAENGLITVGGNRWPMASFPEIGDYNVDLSMSAAIGMSAHNWPAWATAELGYQVRFSGYVNGIVGSTNLGFALWPGHLTLGLHLNGVLPVAEDPSPELQASKSYLYVEGSVGWTVIPALPALGVSFGVGSGLFSRNAASGISYSTGISYSY